MAILALGGFLNLGYQVYEEFKALEYLPSLINPGYITDLDTTTLDELKKDHTIIITLEDGSLDGGFGQKISAYYSHDNWISVYNYGSLKEFTESVPLEDLYEKYHLTPKQIVEDVKKG